MLLIQYQNYYDYHEDNIPKKIIINIFNLLIYDSTHSDTFMILYLI